MKNEIKHRATITIIKKKRDIKRSSNYCPPSFPMKAHPQFPLVPSHSKTHSSTWFPPSFPIKAHPQINWFQLMPTHNSNLCSASFTINAYPQFERKILVPKRERSEVWCSFTCYTYITLIHMPCACIIGIGVFTHFQLILTHNSNWGPRSFLIKSRPQF